MHLLFRARHQFRQGWPKATALLLCAFLFAAGGAGCGDSDDAVSEEEVRDLLKEDRQKDRLKELRDKLREERKKDRTDKTETTTTPPSGTQCGDGVVAVTSATSCPFARETARVYRNSGGSSTIEVYSTVTGQSYTMSCTSGSPNRCSGGNNAVVSFP